jgi:polar amino acid transport system permease protein
LSEQIALANIASMERARRRKEQLWNAGLLIFLAFAAWGLRDLRWEAVVQTIPYLLMALGRSWLLAIMSIGFGFILALPLAAGRVYGPIGVRHVCVGIIEVVRATPELMVVFWIYFAYPALTGQVLSPWWAATVALSVISAAYLAEVIRGGLYSVSGSQREAGISSGLTEFQTLRHVILPQAIHSMVPAFIAQLVSQFKTTSIVYIIGVIEFFRAVVLMNNVLFAPYAFYITLAGGYFVCCYLLSWLVRRLDPQYTLVE